MSFGVGWGHCWRRSKSRLNSISHLDAMVFDVDEKLTRSLKPMRGMRCIAKTSSGREVMLVDVVSILMIFEEVVVIFVFLNVCEFIYFISRKA